MIFCSMIEDFCFYFSHRTLHHPKIYSTIHKIHHENKVVFCLAAIHTHPVEYLMGNIFPMIFGPLLLWHRIHRASTFAWYFIRACETLDAHCGYSFPWSPFRLLPFQLDQDFHYYHHESNVGNYATFFTWWDTIFGTNNAFHK
jgi:sterol desaturase/sphingolipid hydroxylase (fatty acid hydroxylase superfamily)